MDPAHVYEGGEAWFPPAGWALRRALAAGPRHGHGHGRPPHRPGPPFGPGARQWGGFQEQFFGRGPKVGRGDVRAAILVLLTEEPMHGYQIIQELTERSGGVWRPSPGSIYPTLQQLEDEGLVIKEKTQGRRVYRLTDAGTAEVNSRKDEPAPWEAAADLDTMSDLREIGFGVASAVMQVARTGNPKQVEQAMDILKATRKSLYKLLAEDDEEPATPGE